MLLLECITSRITLTTPDGSTPRKRPAIAFNIPEDQHNNPKHSPGNCTSPGRMHQHSQDDADHCLMHKHLKRARVSLLLYLQPQQSIDHNLQLQQSESTDDGY